MDTNEEVIVNRFEQVLTEWVALHDEELHFRGHDPEVPIIKLCGASLRVRANDAWSKLPKHLKEAMVAHELGHREMGHAAVSQNNPFYRLGFVMRGAVDPRELEADRYAVKLIGREKYIKALEECQKSTTNHSAATEYRLRIKELLNENCNS
jgi:hypothetical protein